MAKTIIILFLLTHGVMSCKSSPQQDQNIENPAILPQSEAFLLSGMSAAVCYSGFRTGQHPDRGQGAVNPSNEEILEDLQILSEQTPFRLIRLYDCEENSQMVLDVIKKHDLDFKVLLGIWLRAEIDSYETCAWLTEPWPKEILERNKKMNTLEIEKGIELANEYNDIIAAVNVGNESLVDWNEHRVDVDTVITYVKRVQQAIKQPVTVADNYKWWADNGEELAEIVDFVSIHIYPIWEGRDIDEGISYSIENVKEVKSALPGKQIVITEAGWATTASEFGPRASQEKQKQYVKELMSWSESNNVTTFIFEAFDEDWKGDPNNPMGAEKHWGLYTVDRQPKEVIGLFSEK